MEQNQVEKFDPAKLMDGVKDRIKSTFVSLIPDDMWAQMIEKEIYIFTTGRIENKSIWDDVTHGYKVIEVRTPYSGADAVYNQWHELKTPEDISPLQKMIREELTAKFKTDLEEFLNGKDYQSAFNEYGKPEISKAVEQILVKNSDTIFANFLATVMEQGMQSFKIQLFQKMNGHY